MLFHFTWIKNTFEKNYTVEYLIEGVDYNKPKAFLSEETIIVLWFDEYGKSDTVEEFLAQLINMELNVISVGSYAEELKEEKTKPIIERLTKQLTERKDIYKRKKEEAQKKNMLNYTDDRLKKSYAAIDQVVEQIDQLLKIWDWNIMPETRKKFDDIRWEIAKLRLATNIDKIVDELHMALNLIIETQDYVLWKLAQDKVYNVVVWSQVTNVEVIREQTKLVKSKILQTIWAPMTTEETSYIQLWYWKLFASFFQKDFLYKIQDKFPIVKWCFWWAEFAVIFIILEMVILAVFWSYIWVNLSLQRFWIIFLYLGVLGLLFRVINEYIRPQSIAKYGAYFVLLVLCYMWIMYALKIILVF